MAKGQMRSTKEKRKPKAAVKAAKPTESAFSTPPPKKGAPPKTAK